MKLENSIRKQRKCRVFHPLHLTLAIVLILFFLLAALAGQGTFFPVDYWAREVFGKSTFPLLYPWMRMLTHLAEGSWITPFCLAGLGFLWWRNQKYEAIFFLVYTIGFSPLPTLLKLLIARPRPHAVISDYAVSGYGFPSGHAFAAMAFYGFLAYLLGRHIRHRLLRWTICTLCVVAILGVGISRIYLQRHWVSDVFGGYLGGGAYLLAAICLLKSIEEKTTLSTQGTPSE